MEAELQRVLQEETRRRHQFIVQLAEVVMGWRTEPGPQHRGVQEMLAQLQRADDIITPLLLQCQRLSLQDLSRKENREQRDSGFTPSCDLGAVKRQGVFVPATEVREEDHRQETPQQPPPESDRGDKNTPPPGEPTQNTDESSDADSASS